MVDAGYPNRPGYLSPYKGKRYHVPEWRRGPAPIGEQEHFNHLHSSIRNVVERSFGVWKMKWKILLKKPGNPMEKQKNLFKFKGLCDILPNTLQMAYKYKATTAILPNTLQNGFSFTKEAIIPEQLQPQPFQPQPKPCQRGP
jgi:hypothetical protein